MKKLLLLLALSGLVLFFSQCKKSKSDPVLQTSISYPNAGLYGPNPLCWTGTLLIQPADEFSLAANLQPDATLRVVITNLDDNQNGLWWYDSASNKNWVISDYSAILRKQTFTAVKGSSTDLSLGFTNSGKCQLEVYENGSQSITKLIILIWNQ